MRKPFRVQLFRICMEYTPYAGLLSLEYIQMPTTQSSQCSYSSLGLFDPRGSSNCTPRRSIVAVIPKT
ncbi:hypothetical protein BDV39DRAFT_171735 [Aspergillus sergii]|uniref:Uncharacterized protein n=1 Tax=Aspergillus sergii TaxID=1034303 RepID=A0A5N6X9V2_9EURO|nr:hypothetical protein BDV39DRAFT_171735 [Aspergillus sergii]